MELDADCIDIIVSKVKDKVTLLSLSRTTKRANNLTKFKLNYYKFKYHLREALKRFTAKGGKVSRKKRLLYAVIDVLTRENNVLYWATSKCMKVYRRREIIYFVCKYVFLGEVMAAMPTRKRNKYVKIIITTLPNERLLRVFKKTLLNIFEFDESGLNALLADG